MTRSPHPEDSQPLPGEFPKGGGRSCKPRASHPHCRPPSPGAPITQDDPANSATGERIVSHSAPKALQSTELLVILTSTILQTRARSLGPQEVGGSSRHLAPPRTSGLRQRYTKVTINAGEQGEKRRAAYLPLGVCAVSDNQAVEASEQIG